MATSSAEPVGHPARTPVLRMRHITRRFPGTLALDGVDLEVEAGTIHGLLGENGAGKSTLLRILAGDHPPSSGVLELEGDVVEIASPVEAHDLGIGIVYQELSLLPNLSVADNISLGDEPTRGLAIDERAVRAAADHALGRIGMAHIDPDRLVASLSLAERQLVEIAKVLTLRKPRILIFDEPTAALNHHDVERLFGILRGLRDQGIAIIFVSHRYREVLEICDVATVLRNGRVVGTVQRGEATLARLVELTLGQQSELALRRERRGPHDGAPALVVRELSVGAWVDRVSLKVGRGEIVSVCGLLGSGHTELARAICGDGAEVSGDVRILDASARPTSPREAVRHGAGLIPEDRKVEALFPDLSVARNISIASLGRLLVGRFVRFIRPGRERSEVEVGARRTGIAQTVLSRPVMTLSGGNQQKSVLARWLMRGCDLLVCIEPTRGVDVGAKLEIHRQLERLAQDGAGVLVVSTDLTEVLSLSDRVLVMYRGRLGAELDPRVATEQDLLLAMQGGAAGERTGFLEEAS
jgi:ABC-type sugar transport system ATPase subunit